MIEIQNNKILLAGKELQFDNKIIEAAEYEGKVVIVFETDEDGGYDNVFCYTQDLQLLWRIKPAPVAIGGTASKLTSHIYLGIFGKANLFCISCGVNPLFGFDGGAIGTAVGESLEKVDGGKKRSLLEIVGDSLVLGGVSKGLNFVAHTAITFDAYYWMGTVLNKEYL